MYIEIITFTEEEYDKNTHNTNFHLELNMCTTILFQLSSRTIITSTVLLRNCRGMDGRNSHSQSYFMFF